MSRQCHYGMVDIGSDIRVDIFLLPRVEFAVDDGSDCVVSERSHPGTVGVVMGCRLVSLVGIAALGLKVTGNDVGRLVAFFKLGDFFGHPCSTYRCVRLAFGVEWPYFEC